MICPRCQKETRLPEMSHAPQTWAEAHFPGVEGLLVCRPCKRELQEALKAPN